MKHRFASTAQRAAATLLATALLGSGCAGERTTEPSSNIDLTERADDRAIVARVDGRPVFADCVQRQARAHELSPADALDECIGFELLAQEAERRGYASNPAVAEVRKTEAARALIQDDFEASHADPSAIPRAALQAVWAQPALHSRYNHPEYRWLFYARAEVPRTEAGTEADERAHALAQKLYDRLKGKVLTGRTAFFDAAEQVAAETPGQSFAITRSPYNTPLHGRADPAFAAAAFAIPQKNMVSPPTRTPWGWDIILYGWSKEARRASLDEVADEVRKLVFDGWRKSEFMVWSKHIADTHSVEVNKVAIDSLADDDTLASADVLAPSPGP